jgi:hypothetical protein
MAERSRDAERERAAILARARANLVLIESADLLARVKRLSERAAPPIIYKVNPNALITRPRLKYHVTENARRWR